MDEDDVLYIRFRLRGYDVAEFIANNDPLLERELGMETDTGRAKLGDSRPWNDIPFHVTPGFIDFRDGITNGQALLYDDTDGVFRPGDVGGGGGGGVSFGFITDTGSTADSDPGAGLLKWNHATQTSATVLYIDDTDAVFGASLATFFTDLASNAATGWVHIIASDGSAFQVWKWSSITNGSGYRKFNVALSSSSGTFADDVDVSVTFTPIAPVTSLPSDVVQLDVRSKIWCYYHLANGFNVLTATGTAFVSDGMATAYRTSSASMTASILCDAGGAYARIGTGTSTSGGIRFFANSAGLTFNAQAGVIRYRTRIRIPTLSDGTQRFVVDVGFANAITGATRVLQLSYTDNQNSGQWRFISTGSGGTTTVNTTTAVVAATWYNIDIVIESSTSAKAYVNDVLVATITTNIPFTDNIGAAVFITKVLGSTERLMELEYHEVTQTVSR